MYNKNSHVDGILQAVALPSLRTLDFLPDRPVSVHKYQYLNDCNDQIVFPKKAFRRTSDAVGSSKPETREYLCSSFLKVGYQRSQEGE